MASKLKFIIIDRLTRARDNGEYFYRYLKKNHPEVELVFGLHKDATDWARLKAEGFNLVDLNNLEAIKKAAIGCTHFLFSEANLGYAQVAKVLDRQKITFIYLNHGCYFQKGSVVYPMAKLDYMICGNRREHEATIYNAKQRGWNTKAFLLTGFPRMDEQTIKYRNTKTKNIVLIQPWWRENLTTWRLVESTNKISNEALKKLAASDFVKGFNKLLNSQEFKDICEKNNLQVIFKRHPVMEHIPGIFEVPEWIINEPNELFIDIFAKTKLYITDYSSNAWEVANLGVPCIYFEPDYENLTKNCKRPESIWNVKTDGLGPVTFNVEDFLSVFKTLINNNFILDQKYLDRRKEQIVFLNDTNNCKRCFEAISKLTKVTDKTATKKTPVSGAKNGYYLYF